MRTFVILNNHKDIDFHKNIIAKLPKGSEVYAFGTIEKNEYGEKTEDYSFSYHPIPEDQTKNIPMMRNYIMKWFLDNKKSGYLHFIEDNVEITSDPTIFLDKIEEMMSKFKLDSWFNCSCDPVNYVYSRFNPRYELVIDDDEAKKTYDKTILLCSNANTTWTTFNLDICEYEKIRLDDRFTIAMYYIIEFLANRRNNKNPGQLHYMNMYPTIKEELDVFKSIPIVENNVDEKEKQRIQMEEDKLFHSLNINYKPDHDIVMISEDIRKMLCEK